MINRLFFFTIFSFLVLLGGRVYSQTTSDIRINEVLLYNDSNIVDEYGVRSSWIEIFNSAYNKVNIGGCFLSNDRKNPKKFKIIKGAANSIIEARSYLLFWADNDTIKGVNHLNFNLNEGDFIGFYDQDLTLIDSVILINQVRGLSIGSASDGSFEKSSLSQITPMGTNFPEEQVSTAEKFRELDPTGIGMAIIAMSVVFISLILLYLVFRQIGLRFQKPAVSLKAKEAKKAGEEEQIEELPNGGVYAAIGLALYMYTSELHDFEEAVLTINKVSRSYSPWSSKIYGLRQTPRT